MHFVSSTNDYVIGDLARPGFPILLWENMSSCTPGNEFLRFWS